MRLAALAVAVLALATACGGGHKHAASTPATTAAAATTATKSTTTTKHAKSSPSASAGGQTVSSRSAFASPSHCTILRSLGGKVSQAIPPAFNVSRTNLAVETATLKAFAASVPTEIRGDFDKYVGVFTRYMQVYASIGLKPGKAPTKAQYERVKKAASDVINTPGLAAAEQHLKRWIRVNCPKPQKR